MPILIYKHTNIKTNKSYIGQTSQSLNDRKGGSKFSKYLQKKNGKFIQPKFAEALINDGVENFESTILFDCGDDKKLANEKEEFYITLYDTINNGYNEFLGQKLTEEYIKNHLAGENNPNFGKHLSENARKRLSDYAKTRTGDKNPSFGKKGKLSPVSKTIIRIETGEEFESCRDAVGVSQAKKMARAIKNNWAIAGYHYKYKEQEN